MVTGLLLLILLLCTCTTLLMGHFKYIRIFGLFDSTVCIFDRIFFIKLYIFFLVSYFLILSSVLCDFKFSSRVDIFLSAVFREDKVEDEANVSPSSPLGGAYLCRLYLHM